MAAFSDDSVSQVGRFGLVGVANTLIDFAIFNLLTSKMINLSKVKANLCSTTVAMIFSFFVNREAVFARGTANPTTQAIEFILVTGFGLYVLQTGLLYLLIKRWRWPARLVLAIIKYAHLSKRVSADFALKNSAKAAGTFVSLVWNFFMYKYLVFR